jgi:hypothetical protein
VIRPALIALALTLAAAPAVAGPPYVTDDPEPTDTGHWENYAYVQGSHAPGAAGGQAGLDLNYGAAKDLQLTAILPADYSENGGWRTGAGNLQLSAKYRFLHQAEGSWIPDVAIFPAVSLPTAARGFGSPHATLFLPVWAQKDFGPWSTFGGAGLTLNPGPGNRNYWLTGWAVSRKVNDRLSLGAEIYHQTADTDGARAFTAVGVGATWQLTKHIALMGSGGPSVKAEREAQTSAFFAALLLTY